MVVSQLPPMTQDELSTAIYSIREFTHRHDTATGYYMLLSNELRYYTVFIVNNVYDEPVEDVVYECLENMGELRQVNVEKDRLECWITNEEGCFMFMLFNYDWGIVPCR